MIRHVEHQISATAVAQTRRTRLAVQPVGVIVQLGDLRGARRRRIEGLVGLEAGGCHARLEGARSVHLAQLPQ